MLEGATPKIRLTTLGSECARLSPLSVISHFPHLEIELEAFSAHHIHPLRKTWKQVLEFFSHWWGWEKYSFLESFRSMGCAFIHVSNYQTSERRCSTRCHRRHLTSCSSTTSSSCHPPHQPPTPPPSHTPLLCAVSSERGRGPLLCYIHTTGELDSLITQHRFIRTQRSCSLVQLLTKRMKKHNCPSLCHM